MCVIALPAFASNKGEHDKLFEYIFFNDDDYKRSCTINQKLAINALENAAQLAIDQYENNSSGYLKYLQSWKIEKNGKEYRIKGLPGKIKDINCDAIISNHRNYTHLGWYCDTLSDFGILINIAKNKNWDLKWRMRKNIMRNTVSAVFDFGMNIFPDIFVYSKKCDSFCALIYYTHIIEDYSHDNYESSQSNGYKIVFAAYDCSDFSHTLISEIIYHSKILFEHENDTNEELNAFIDELIELNKETYFLIASDNNIYKEQYDDFKNKVDTLKSIMNKHLNKLLKQEKWFTDVFDH